MAESESFTRLAVTLGWADLLHQLAQLCATSRGQEQAAHLPLLPTPAAVEDDLILVSEARTLLDRGEPLPLEGMADLHPALHRLEKEGALAGATLLQVAHTLRAGARLRRFLRDRQEEIPRLARLAAAIAAHDDISSAILESFDENGQLSDQASPELPRLRRQLTELHDRLVTRMRELMEEPHISKHLQDHFYTQREDRYVLPIRTDAGSAVEGIVHGSSASGASIFIEPKEVVALNNQLKVAEIEVAREEARVLIELSGLVGEELFAIRENLMVIERLDVINARARLSRALAAHPPRLAADGHLQLLAIRHPLMVLAGSPVVSNDLTLGPQGALIITGPNAGGKTVCLKTLGLCALMVRAGMHLPVGPDSVIPFYDQVLAEMGDEQSIEANLSTFTAHLTHLLAFLATARPGVLILLDEIAVGTDPGEGAALAQALLEAIVETGAQLVVTTHYERLKSLPLADPRFTNASMGFDLQRLSPTFHLQLGVPGSSGALSVARRLGLDPALVQRAESLLDRGAQDVSALLATLTEERTRVAAERQELQTAMDEAQTLAEKHRQELQTLRDKGRQSVQSTFAQALEELKRARQELERVRALLRRPPSKERVEQAERQISQASAAIRRHEPRPELPGRPAAISELISGTRVIVQSLGGEGEVLEPPQRGKALVRVGGIRAQVPVEEIVIPPSTTAVRPASSTAASTDRRLAAPPTREREPMTVAPAHDQTLTPLRTDDITLDVRGLRVHEALNEAERFLDRALRDGDNVLFIIHGHGTGALRAALREHLNASPLVDRVHPAQPREGGEGVTVVWLRE